MGRGGDGAGAELCGAYKRGAGSRSGAHVRTGESVRGRTPPVWEREAALTGLLRARPGPRSCLSGRREDPRSESVAWKPGLGRTSGR